MPRPYRPATSLIIIVGNYGSGKTEVAVNLALSLQRQGKQVRIADLDIVNPYFRCREARETMEQQGIEVVTPPGVQRFADLPIVVPEIKGMLRPQAENVSIFDVGGDDVGATLLSSLAENLGDSPYQLLQVINARRPFTNTVEGCLKMKGAIEQSSRLSVNGLICNSHLVTETTTDVILEGVALARQVAARAGIDIAFVSAMAPFDQDPLLQAIDEPLLVLDRIMLPPWLRPSEKGDSSSRRLETDPAPAVKPIGRP